MESTSVATATAPTLSVQSDKDIKFAYRRFGKGSDLPLVLHMHFRGNMDFWDPLLLDTLAQEREVIIFDNAGVGRSNGQIPPTFAGWAADTITFIQALGLTKVDLFGFSMGSITALEAALAAPQLIRKLILAGCKPSVPSSPDPIPGLVFPQDQAVPEAVAALISEDGIEGLRISCFPDTKLGNAAFDAYWKRIEQRSVETPQLQTIPMDQGGFAQLAAMADYDVPQKGSSFDRLSELKMPVLVLNGNNDKLIPTSRSWELMKMVENAQLIIYPRSGHGFIWQYSKRVAQDVNRFLNSTDFE